MFKNPFAKFDLSKPFGDVERSRRLFGTYTTPREWKHGARDMPFGLGAKSLYVDGIDGHDSNDGESWITAKKTIQAAVDTAASWTNIFVKAATYAENVTIAAGKESLSVFGERKSTTLIAPSTGHALDVLASFTLLHSIGMKATENYRTALYLRANDCSVLNSELFSGAADYSYGIVGAGDRNILHKVVSSSAKLGAIYPSGDFWDVSRCVFSGCNIGIYQTSGANCRFFENLIKDTSSYGIRISGDKNTIFHNNLINNTIQVRDGGSTNEWFENFYDDHIVDTNNNGLCDSPYSFIGGIDYQPVSRRNGWNQISLGHGPEDLQLATKSITLGTGAPPVTETLFTVTGEVEVLLSAYINTAVTSAGSLTLEAGIAGATAGLIAQTAVANLTINKMWIDATPAVLVSKPSWKIIANGGNIIHTIATAAATAGAVTYYCWWRPLSTDGKVVAA